ncbi:nitric oxide-associated protein 1 [Contarinia nasturtii]|uniref:nitric oxide-associated protein 1 n=1 Tax=Contarinia nasturtii TaxID=265458 RepID=UPI0012D4948B|nr:nitric oxide-associated protein 1 [Contarinia nasturtii]
MIRILQSSQKLTIFSTNRRLLHIVKSIELDEPAYHKTPIDPQIVSLVKKYESDIIYSSAVESYKKPLSYKQRAELKFKLNSNDYKERLEKARAPTVSLIAQKFAQISKLKENEETQPVAEDEPLKVVNESEPPEKREEKAVLAKAKLEILTELNMRQSALDYELQSVPGNWMEDYETYDEKELMPETQYGTPDPNARISNVPCHGCGANLHCADPSIPGYLPSELIKGHDKNTLQRLTCQRCHFLKNYNTALKVQVNADDYINMLSKIKDEWALAILMVDLTDFPCSIWPNIVDIIGEKRPVIVVGNKIDLLPQDSIEYLKHIKECLEDSLIQSGLTKTNIKHTCLISSKTNYGIEDLITTLYAIWPNKGDVYLMGNTNVGKSTLFNALLGSDYCKIRARSLIRRATSSLWPGTTLRMLKFPIARPSNALLIERQKRLQNEERQRQALESLRLSQVFSGRQPEKTLMEHIGLTYELEPESKFESAVELTDAPPLEKYFNENHKAFKFGKWLYDTPGVIQNEQIINLLTSEELLYTIPKETLWPRVFILYPGQTLFLSGLGRIDYTGGASEVRLAVYASEKLSILITSTNMADEIYEQCLGTDILNVPRGTDKRLQEFPALKRHSDKISIGNYAEFRTISACDIILSSAGWVSVNIPPSQMANFHAWTPEGRGIFVRKPALLPYAAELYRGKRMRFTPAYTQKEPKQVMY